MENRGLLRTLLPLALGWVLCTGAELFPDTALGQAGSVPSVAPDLKPGQPDGKMLEHGTLLLAEHDLAGAEAVARQIVLAQPMSAPGMYLLGTILEAEHKAKESLEWFTRAAVGMPPSGEQLRVVALDYVLLNSYSDAVHWLTRSVELDQDNAEAWYDLGRARMMQGDMHGARQPLERARALKPGQVKVLNNLGVVAEAENRPAEAESLYRQAISLQAGGVRPSEQPLLNLGKLMLEQGKADEALALLLAAVQAAPGDARCREQLARAEEQHGDRSEAIAQMERAVTIEPESPALHYQLGQLYRRAGLSEKAKAELSLSGSLYKASPSGTSSGTSK